MAPFGIDPLHVTLGLLAIVLASWAYTMYCFRRAAYYHRQATFWWIWWANEAVKAGIRLDTDVVERADASMPPEVSDQVIALAADPIARMEMMGIDVPEALLDDAPEASADA